MLIFKKNTPESTGIKSSSISRFLVRLAEKQVPMHSVLLLHKDTLIAEGYYKPYTKDTLHRMFSISKSFTAIAIGLLEAEGKLSLSDPICNFFPEYVSEDTHPWIHEMTIRDMLMMRTCHAATTYKVNMQSNWVESFFTVPPTHPAGKFFHYDTSSAHTLCALVERLSGMDMLSYLKEKLAPLGLSEESYMLKDPFGISLGGSGLVAKPMDLLKFGYLIMHEGAVPASCITDASTSSKNLTISDADTLQLVPASYLRDATSNLTPTVATAPLPSESCGYGYQIWQNEKGGYVCYGMGGQFIIFLPKYDLICVTTADTQGMAGGNQLIYDALYEEILPYISDAPLAESPSEYEHLCQQLNNLAIAPLANTLTISDCQRFSGKEYTLLDNKNGFSKLSVEFIESQTNDSLGVTKGILHYTLYNQECELHFGFNHLELGNFPGYDMKYAASAEWISHDILYIRAHIIDEYLGSVRFELTFGENDVTVFFKKVEESLFNEYNGHLYGVYSN